MYIFFQEYLPDTGSTPQNSTSLRRPPGPLDQNVKGASTNYPFWPGGLDEPILDNLKITDDKVSDIDFENGNCFRLKYYFSKIYFILRPKYNIKSIFGLLVRFSNVHSHKNL